MNGERSDGLATRTGGASGEGGAMAPRAEHALRFADGGTLELGRRTRVMGILNLTPDSFSDGGKQVRLPDALAAAHAMVEVGVDLIDVGGESTRPGARPVDAQEEGARILPTIEALKKRHAVRVSVDTRKAEVARRALDAGADMVNDVSGLRDPAMLPLLCERRAPVVIMHMRGDPATMQHDTRYADLLGTLSGFLQDRVASAVAAGLAEDLILIDPGIGFGKSAQGNLTILRELPRLAALGRPLVIGASRKSFIGQALGGLAVDERLEGSLAVAAVAVVLGAHIVRAHDVPQTLRAVRMVDAIRKG
jgi:dihydropteroate synthase